MGQLCSMASSHASGDEGLVWARPSHDDGRSTRGSTRMPLSTNIPLVNGERHMAKPRAGNFTAHRSEGHYKLHGIGHGERKGWRLGSLMQSTTRCNGLFIACMNVHVF